MPDFNPEIGKCYRFDNNNFRYFLPKGWTYFEHCRVLDVYEMPKGGDHVMIQPLEARDKFVTKQVSRDDQGRYFLTHEGGLVDNATLVPVKAIKEIV